MSILKLGVSALGKLIVVGALAATFFAAMFVVIWLSLRGDEVKVPEVVGKDFYESEKEFADLGLRIRRRATRYSKEKPNTILEQLPKAGETVKTGQTILVVLSEANPEGNEEPATVETPAIEETASESGSEVPKKTSKNANVKRPVSMTRDQIANKAGASNRASSNAVPSNTGVSNATATPRPVTSTQANRAQPTPTPIRVGSSGANTKPANPKPANSNPSSGGDLRNRKIP